MNIIIKIQNVSCPNQMLAATLFAGYKCIGVQMLIKIYLFGGRFFVRNEVRMKVENGKFYFIKDEFIKISLRIVRIAEDGINIPFYNIIEMKNILLK